MTNYQTVVDFAAELMLEPDESPDTYSTEICILTGTYWDFTFYPFTSSISDDEEDEEDAEVMSVTETILEDFHLSCEIGNYSKIVNIGENK
jgi:hypothetical protein